MAKIGRSSLCAGKIVHNRVRAVITAIFTWLREPNTESWIVSIWFVRNIFFIKNLLILLQALRILRLHRHITSLAQSYPQILCTTFSKPRGCWVCGHVHNWHGRSRSMFSAFSSEHRQSCDANNQFAQTFSKWFATAIFSRVKCWQPWRPAIVLPPVARQFLSSSAG